jgi:uncharacterized protein YfaP (DUF2135 family)
MNSKMVSKAILLSFCLVSGLASAANVQVLSATVKNKNLEGVTATLQKNGQASINAVSDSRGQINLNGATAADSDSLLILKKAGYSTLIVKCPCDGMTYAMSPEMQNLDGLRVVLNWGRSPNDLDSHMVFPSNHIYFEKKKGQRANLDVDDTDSYGPETITVDEKVDGQRYVYAVHNYSQKSKSHSTSLGQSRAQVMVYIGKTLIKTYRVDPSKDGTLWVVFGIDEMGEFHDINQYTYASSPVLTGNYLKEVMTQTDMAKPLSTSVEAVASAKRLNAKGEKLYHQNNYDSAIALFQEAIENWGEYGQAYSNLGLTFQRAGRTAEAIWANRKAIALADGANKDRIKASSYYNIAKIYESQGEWAKAKHQYELALSLRQHDAYVQGISRMNEKLN